MSFMHKYLFIHGIWKPVKSGIMKHVLDNQRRKEKRKTSLASGLTTRRV
jgi:hypothetical protein